MKRKIIEWWKNSRLLEAIDRMISESFRRKLKNDNFTILCSNCLGGMLYHRFGKEFCSPTINLFMTNPDFADFCLNLDYYLDQKLSFIDSEEEYPVAVLRGNGKEIPEITIHFNHDNINAEAEAKWERRKLRINRDNLYIMMYYLDGITVEKLKCLENIKCRNKVVLTATPIPEITWSYYIKPNMKAKYPYAYFDKDVFGVRQIEKKFDIAGFLNSNTEE